MGVMSDAAIIPDAEALVAAFERDVADLASLEPDVVAQPGLSGSAARRHGFCFFRPAWTPTS
jgi:hypothetical protein